MAKKHRKIKKHYTIAVTSDYSVDKTKYYRSRVNLFRFTIIMNICVVLLGVGLTAFEFYELNQMESKLRVFKGIIAEQKNIIDDLGSEKAELTSQNEILNNTVAMAMADKEREEEEYNARHLPSGFPLTGSASIVDISVMDGPEQELAGYFNYDVGNQYSTEADKAIEENPISVFEMSSISDVVATADGTVLSITEDDIFTRCIEIDHGNGYITIYRNNADPKVSVGDEVVRGAILFVGGDNNIYLGYQIKYNETYVDPMQIIAIDG